MFAFMALFVLLGCNVPFASQETAFDLGPNLQLDARSDLAVEILFPTAMNPQSVKDHLKAPGKIKDLTDRSLVLELPADSSAEIRVIVKAGALDQGGRRLSKDWVVVVRRPVQTNVRRDETSDGFRWGPLNDIADVQWVDKNRVYAGFGSQSGQVLGTISLSEAEIAPLADRSSGYFGTSEAMLDGQVVLYASGLSIWLQGTGNRPRELSKGLTWRASPDGTRVVIYEKNDSGHWVDLRTGAQHVLPAPGYYGSDRFDSWSPDGRYYLVQSMRNGKVPGFYLMDADGQLSSTFEEQGFFSFWARWSPDSRHIAFLSVPMDTDYPLDPEVQIGLQPIAPRLGVVDVVTGQTQFFTMAGKTAQGAPLWSPDGKQVAIRFGELHLDKGYAEVVGGRIFVADLAARTLRPITEEVGSDRLVLPISWSPDSATMVSLSKPLSRPDDTYSLIKLEDRTSVVLPGEIVQWVDPEHLITLYLPPESSSEGVLTLLDRSGIKVRDLGRNVKRGSVRLSPTGEYVAYVTREAEKYYLNISRLPH